MLKKLPSSQRGFALVIALSLMAFVLLLVLSISTLVQVESQSATAGMQQMRARLNAQLGAMIALGDLQRYTGPDRRVTARADILLAPGANDVSGQSRWTGVWSASDITDTSNISSPAEGLAYGLDLADGLQNNQARWLVSGHEDDDLIIDSNIELSNDITVDLATIGGSVANKSSINRNDTVKVPKVEILGENNVAVGHYAFWVSDEGVKARVNMADPFLDKAGPQAEYYRTAMAQVADPTAVSNLDGVQLLAGTDSRWKVRKENREEDPSKISSHENIPMFLKEDLEDLGVANLSSVSREFFHDFTVHSSGVLANTKDGGLKRDLSTALIDLPDDMKEGGINSPMFPPANQISRPGEMDPGGPKWEQLSDYYKLAKDNSTFPGDKEIALKVPTNDQVGFTPIITRSNFFVQGFAERNVDRENSIYYNPAESNFEEWCKNTTGTKRGSAWADWDQFGDWYLARGYKYSLGMFPLVTLWNPYDRKMSLGKLGLEFELPRINIVESEGSMNVVANTSDVSSTFNDSEEVKRRTVKFVIEGGTLMPGEAVNFSPPSNSFYDRDNPSNNMLVARQSAPFVTGFFTEPLPSFSSQPFWDDNRAPNRSMITSKWSRSRLSLNFGINPTNGNIPNFFRQLVMLYSSPELTNNQFRTENRFKAVDINAHGNFAGRWKQPRVILIDRLVGLGGSGRYNEHINQGVPSNPEYVDPYASPGTSYFSDFVGGKSDSTKRNPSGTKDFIVGNELSDPGTSMRVPWGAVGTMRFPNVPRQTFAATGNELDLHLFLYMNPTAPVIDKEPSLSWALVPNSTKERNELSEYNVYSKGHLQPWKNNGQKQYYDEIVAAGTDTKRGFIGLSNTKLGGGSERMVLFEVPDNIPLSIGQLAQANLMNLDVYGGDHPQPTMPAIGNVIMKNGDGGWNSNTLQPYTRPMYAIGNSIASPFLPLERTEQWLSPVRAESNRMLKAGYYDYSYKLNDALWDEYFFSGITDDSQVQNWIEEEKVFPLPNSRLRRISPLSTNSDFTTENRCAANLQLDGAFNINSTSVAAWEAVLGAMREIETSGYKIEEDNPTLRHNFARFNEPLLGTPDDEVPSLSNIDKIAAGYRNLTDAQIASLAREIVDEIRLRKNSATGDGYPFLSLSEFINRSPNNKTQDFQLRGALQAAIDKSNLNGLQSSSSGLWADSAEYPIYNYSNSSPNPEVIAQADRPKVDGMLGSFIQSDLLAKIGSFIQARSDTFTIRSYGSTKDQFVSNESSRAYYEIVVQRTPSYVDPSDIDYENADQSTNQKFGRRYQIKSQRWVSSDEI